MVISIKSVGYFDFWPLCLFDSGARWYCYCGRSHRRLVPGLLVFGGEYFILFRVFRGQLYVLYVYASVPSPTSAPQVYDDGGDDPAHLERADEFRCEFHVKSGFLI